MHNRLFHKAMLAAFAVLLLAGSVTAAAEDRCERRIRTAEMHLQQAVQRHGEHSKQAQKKRRHLEEVRATCHR